MSVLHAAGWSAPRESNLALARTQTESRCEMMDAVRLLAAAAVVFTHSVESTTMLQFDQAGRFAVHFYLYAGIYFLADSIFRRPDRTTAWHIANRLKRLYLPFVLWSVVYFVARNVKRTALSGKSPIEIDVKLLWTGTQYHLWFLPYLLALSLASVLIFKAIARNERWRKPVIIIASVGALFFCAWPIPSHWSPNFEGTTYAYLQWTQAAPSAFGAIVLAAILTRRGLQRRIPTSFGIVGAIVALAATAYQVSSGFDVAARAIAGLGMFCFALLPLRHALLGSLAKLGRYSFGIYLLHVLIVEIIHASAHRANVPASAPLDLITFAVGFGLSLMIVIAWTRVTAKGNAATTVDPPSARRAWWLQSVGRLPALRRAAL